MICVEYIKEIKYLYSNTYIYFICIQIYNRGVVLAYSTRQFIEIRVASVIELSVGFFLCFSMYLFVTFFLIVKAAPANAMFSQ